MTVRLKSDPARIGTLTGESREIAGRIQKQVEFRDGTVSYYFESALEEVIEGTTDDPLELKVYFVAKLLGATDSLSEQGAEKLVTYAALYGKDWLEGKIAKIQNRVNYKLTEIEKNSHLTIRN